MKINNLSDMKSRSNAGFSLIESLISLLILGIGLLGLGSLQVTSMKGSENAHARTVANMLAFDLADRMRSNPVGVSLGAYNRAENCSGSPRNCRRNTVCTPTQLAIYDIHEVVCGAKLGTRKREGGVVNSLLNGSFSIQCPDGLCTEPRARHNITINWGERQIDKDQAVDANSVRNRSIIVPVRVDPPFTP